MSWDIGDPIMWCYRREVVPGRVVRDDDRLAVWIAPATPLLIPVPADGKDLRDRPAAERFSVDRNFEVRPWFGAGVLRIAYPGQAHSSWLFRRPDEPETFWGWYGNLESSLVRTKDEVHSFDHVLDVWMDADGTVQWKDEDELEAAVVIGKFTEKKAKRIRSEGERVFAAMEQGDPPYDGSWLDWKPDPAWTLPELPEKYAALAGQPSYELFPQFEDDD